MATTIELVIDEILGQFKSHWDANVQAMSGLSYVPKMITEADRDETDTQNPDQAWVRLVIRHNSVGPPTLAEPGARRFTRYGTVYAQIFSPFLSGEGFTLSQRLAQVARDAYEGRRTPTVIFRSCRINEAGRDGPWHQVNLVADFEWDEVK
jgi:hypothetical protein